MPADLPSDDGDREPALLYARHRPYLLGVAYRLTGSWADAEDAVADAWPRWERHAAVVDEPRAWLTRVVSRLCLDHLRSARVRRETYVGPWLPEPIVTTLHTSASSATDPQDALVLDESVRMAFLVVLDALTPEQRVAVVLHDVLALPFADVAGVLSCSAEAARQHAVRGRRRVEEADPPERVPAEDGWQVLEDLADALADGDAGRIAALLAPDVVMLSDGAGQVTAARRPVVGAEDVGRFLGGLAKRGAAAARLERALVNGDPGFVVRLDSGRPHEPRLGVYTLAVRGGRIAALWAVVAPDKLSRVPAARTPPPS